MAEKVQTIKDIHHNLSQMFECLYPTGEASALATILIEEFTGKGRARQLLEAEKSVTDDSLAKISAAARRICEGVPLQYVLGYTIFCGLRIKVTPSVLIPRPETEEMTAAIISENRGFRGTVIDYCTGSGCIAVALSASFPGAKVYATDLSAEAIRVAMENASMNGADISFHTSDIFSDESSGLPAADIIVSNPPYVRESEKKEMRSNVLDHEPHSALFVPDNDPLKYYSRLAGIALMQLLPAGKIYLEINEALGDETARLFTSKGFTGVTVIKDLHGRDRVLKAERDERTGKK